MRFFADVAGPEAPLPWEYVHGVVYAVVYNVLRTQNPALATQLHNNGWASSSLRPIGVSPPTFSDAPRYPGVYMMSPNGRIWFGSPFPTWLCRC